MRKFILVILFLFLLPVFDCKTKPSSYQQISKTEIMIVKTDTVKSVKTDTINIKNIKAILSK